MRRLFVALPVPHSFAGKIAALPHKNLPAADWVVPEDLHITLRFLGEVEDDKIEPLRESLARISKQPFSVEIEGLGAFQKKGGAVLWAGIASTRKLTALTADINVAVEKLGFEMPRIPFVPHVTLARLEQPRGLEAYIKSQGPQLRHSWQAGGFALMESGEPGESGAHYRTDRYFDFPQYT